MLHIFFLNIILASGSSQLTSFHVHVFRHTCLQCPRLRSEADSSALKPCPASSPAPCRRGPVLRIGCCLAAAGWSCHLWSKPPSLCCCCCPDDCVCRCCLAPGLLAKPAGPQGQGCGFPGPVTLDRRSPYRTTALIQNPGRGGGECQTQERHKDTSSSVEAVGRGDTELT